MKHLLSVLLLTSNLSYATSFSGPGFDGMPGMSLSLGRERPSMPWYRNECQEPRFNSFGTSLSPEVRQSAMEILTSMPDNDEATKEDAEEMLKLMMQKFNHPNSPVFIDPATGRKIPKREADGRPDELKGCVTRTSCHGTGKDRECVSWEVCIES